MKRSLPSKKTTEPSAHEEDRETTALLKILTLGNRQIEEGRVQPAGDVIRGLRDNGKRGR